MWQAVSKGLIFGLILGLILGFAGGYSYKSLNAEAPISSGGATTSDPIEGAILKDSFEKAVNQFGLKAVFGADPTIDKVSSNKPAVSINLLKPIIENAYAQSNVCSKAQLNLVRDIWKKTNDYDYGDNPCYESITEDSILTFSLYQGDNNLSRVDYNVSGVVTYTRWQTDEQGNCKKVVERHPVNFSSSLYWDGTKVVDPPSGSVAWTLVCSGSTRFDWTWRNPAFDKKKCCGLPTTLPPTPTEQ